MIQILEDLDRRPLPIPPGHTITAFEVLEPPRPSARRGSRARTALVRFEPMLPDPHDPILGREEFPE